MLFNRSKPIIYKDTEGLAEGRFTQAGAFIKSPATRHEIGSMIYYW